MFTGIVESTGSLDSFSGDSHGARVRIGCGTMASGLAPGDSVAVDGVCLTVVEMGPDWFAADLSPETLQRTTLGGKTQGCCLNLERPVRLVDRLGGHLVQGHVDGVGSILEVREEGEGMRVRVSAPVSLARYCVEKGSVALDGVSLTIAALRRPELEVSLIPHTLRATSLREWRSGSRVNIEVDLVAKYIEALLAPYPAGAPQEKEP